MLRIMSTLCLVALASYCSAYETEQSVIIGTDDNLDAIIEENEFVLVEFYAPWCGHCKKLEPEYAAAAQQLEEEGSPIKLVKVDATVEEDLASKHDISGFPTLKFFKNGKASDYGGGREKEGIVKYLKKKSGPAAIPVETIEEVDAAKKENPVACFGVFESIDSEEAQAFSQSADEVEHMFFISTASIVAEHLGVKAPAIVQVTNFEDEPFTFDGDLKDSAAINKFVAGHSLPLVIEFNDENSRKIFGGDINTHLLAFAKKSDDTFETMVADMKTAAAEFRGEILFIYIDADVEDNGRILEYFGISADEVPNVRIISMEKDMAKFSPEKIDLTADGLKKFVTDFLAGNLKQTLKAQDVPDDWDAKPVKVLTGKNFGEVALDPAKDVLVEFYAPWCGHCKQLAPIYDQLGEAFDSHSDVVIAKMDSTENEVEDISIQGFPTIMLFPKGENAETVDYDGDRTLSALTEFLNEKSGKSVVVEDSAEETAAHEEL